MSIAGVLLFAASIFIYVKFLRPNANDEFDDDGEADEDNGSDTGGDDTDGGSGGEPEADEEEDDYEVDDYDSDLLGIFEPKGSGSEWI